jgi:2-polyprenyl-3-methyl-5-hydroxy-6-metoxy-1,4-benzoquinol methylase
MKCNLCSSPKVDNLGNIGLKPISVTSDSYLCPLYSRIYICQECNHIQKLYKNEELSIIASLYDNYAPHHLSRGNEQLVFFDNLPPKPRTYHVIENCLPFLPEKGELLDIGTGNGAVLRSASRLLINWELHAFDINIKYEQEVLKIPNVESFTSGGIENLPQKQFNLITLWHVLEHIPDPSNLILYLSTKLKDNGYLLIQVPDVHRNPFDLAVIDHCSHFTRDRLIKLFYSLGFKLVVDGYNWIYNCLTLLLKYEGSKEQNTVTIIDDASPHTYFLWLNRVIDEFNNVIKNRDYALFGTGMASIWLSGQLNKKPAFFIDEDITKSGNNIYGVLIITPEKVPKGFHILMAFTRIIGEKITIKLKKCYPEMDFCYFILSPPYF